MLSHDMIGIMPKKHLSILVFGLVVVVNDGHDTLIRFVIYMAGHGGPLSDTYDMVRHDPIMRNIPTRLHAPTQVDPLPGSTSDILKTKMLSVLSPWQF